MKTGSASKTIPIAIVGIDCIFPKAEDFKEYWANIREGVDAITKVPETHWNIDDYFNEDPTAKDMTYGYTGGFIPYIDFNPLEFAIAPNNMEAIDTSQLLSLVVAKRVMENSGYGLKAGFDRDKTSVVLGITGSLKSIIPLGARMGYPQWRKAMEDAGVEKELIDDSLERIENSYCEWHEQSFPGLLGNVVSGRIANYMDLGGTNCSVDAACGSSLSALHLACMELQSGKSDLVISGGVDTFNDIFMYMCFSKTPALSPTGHAKPFDHKSDGTIIGEGIGIVLLKRLEDAEKDGDKIYAVIKGLGTSSDGKSGSIYAPKTEGQTKAMFEAYKNSGVTPQTVELMEAHGTGTKVGDITEINSITEVYRDESGDKEWCALGSVKSMIGHTKAAAGTAGLMKTALCLHHKVLPPTLKIEKPLGPLNDEDTPFYLNTKKRPWMPVEDHPRRASVSAFGFGGSNYHCVVEEYIKEKTEIDWDGKVQIAALSANNPGDLKNKMEEWKGSLSWRELCNKAELSRRDFNKDSNCRLVLVIEKDKTNLEKLVSGAGIMLDKFPDKKSWNTPDGAYFGSGSNPGSLGVVFPGQGAQYTGMMLDLNCRFPQAYNDLVTANSSFDRNRSKALNKRLVDYIYPKPVFDNEEEAKLQQELTDTRVAQPALGAVSLGAYNLLKEFGIKAEAFAGHSYGELTALCAAGRLKPEELHLLSALRGNLMADREGDLGSMIAVKSDISTVEKVIADHKLDLVIANKNAPDQAVLSGATAEIDRADEVLGSLGIKKKKLPVAAAFHSALISDAQVPFAEALNNIEFPESSTPVFSNTTSVEYPDEPEQARAVLAGQLAKPVQFVDEITNMYRYGIRTFLEVGPGSRMTGLVKSILNDNDDFEALALDSSGGKRNGVNDLARTLGQLAALGYDINLASWDPVPDEELNRKKPKMTIPLCGANYVDPRRKARQKAAKPAKKKVVSNKETKTVATAANAPVKKAVPTRQNACCPKAQQAAQPVAHTPQVASIPAQQGSQAFLEALRITQNNMAALQNIQIQTAQLHQKFLANQDEALKTFQSLALQQQQLMGMTTGAIPQPAFSAPAYAPTPQPEIQQPVSPQAYIPAVQEPVVQEQETFTETAVVETQPRAAGLDAGKVTSVLLDIVSEKTGYPIEMLEPGMNLDSDLGIDSIKRVEIFSGLKERIPEAEAVKAGDIGKLKTLEDIAQYIAGSAVTVQTAVMPAGTGVSEPAISEDAVSGILLELVSEKTGYPQEMLEMDMNLDSDLGIDSIKRVEIFSALKEQVPEANEIKADKMAELKTLRDISRFITDTCKAVTPAPQAAGEPALSPGQVSETLLRLVSDKTGYPVEMLEMEMNLDSDLGIDSIKRVEIFSALKEEIPAAEHVRADQMTTLKTLKDISEFISESSRETRMESPSGVTVTSLMSVTPDQVSAVLVDLVSDKTGYPAEMLELDMSLDSDLGIDSIKRVEIFSALKDQLPAAKDIKAEHMQTLKTLRDISSFISSMSGKEAPQAPPCQACQKKEPVQQKTEPVVEEIREIDTAQVNSALDRLVVKTEKIDEELKDDRISLEPGSEILIAGTKDELTGKIVEGIKAKGFNPVFVSMNQAETCEIPGEISGLLIAAPNGNTDDKFLKNSFKILRKSVPSLRKAAGKSSAVFMTVSRLNGFFGIDGESSGINPISGGLAGLSKTTGHELPGVNCKAVDIDPAMEPEKASAMIIDEIFINRPVEVGISQKGKITLVSEPSLLEETDNPLPFNNGDVIIITGGARGVTAECAVKLAHKLEKESKEVKMLLLGRSTAPEQEPQWLANLTSEGEIKKAIMTNSQKRMTPMELQGEFRRVMSGREILNTITRIDSTGTQVVYCSVDVRDEESLKGVIEDIQSSYGPVTGIIHGAGVIADKLIEDKTDEEFNKVYDTKVMGIRNLLSILKDADLKVVVMFSSSTGRIGRKGQIDYAAANEILNKMACRESQIRKGCRVVSFNWGPWDGGMVTPALKKLFAEEGVAVIPINEGTELLAREISIPEGPVEIVVLGKTECSSCSFVLDEIQEKIAVSQTQETGVPGSNMSIAFERKLNIENYPVLNSHVMDNRAVVPMALIMEWFALGAVHGNPGLRFTGCDKVRVLKGITIDSDETITYRIYTGKVEKQNEHFVVPVELRSSRDGEKFDLNARGEVILAYSIPKGNSTVPEVTSPGYADNNRIYSELLFHGGDLHGIKEVTACSDEGLTAEVKTAPKPVNWITQPLRNSWITDPLVTDSSFQLMILWSIFKYHNKSLPVYAGSYRQYGRFKKDDIRINIKVKEHNETKAVADIEFVNNAGDLIASITNYECIINPSLKEAFSKNRLHHKIMQ